MLSKLLIAWALTAQRVNRAHDGYDGVVALGKPCSRANGRALLASTRMLVRTTGWIILLHLVEIAIWAFFYARQHGMPDLQSAFYFSAVTYIATATATWCYLTSGAWSVASRRADFAAVILTDASWNLDYECAGD